MPLVVAVHGHMDKHSAVKGFRSQRTYNMKY